MISVVGTLPYFLVRHDQANTNLYLQLMAEFSQKTADDLWRELNWTIAANATSCCNDPGTHLMMLQFKQALDRATDGRGGRVGRSAAPVSLQSLEASKDRW